jgi:heterodisulfide reductase subunit A-like polyferredoxin
MENPLYDCLIIGSGPAGLSAGNILKTLGYKICILEKESIPGGKLNLYHELFPCNESATEVLKKMLKPVDSLIRTSIDLCEISKTGE